MPRSESDKFQPGGIYPAATSYSLFRESLPSNTIQKCGIFCQNRKGLDNHHWMHMNPAKQIRFLLLFACLLWVVNGCNKGSSENNNSKEKKVTQGGAFRVEDKKEPVIEYSLTEEQSAYLWDMEHHGNVLGEHGFKPLIKAIVAADREEIIKVVGEPTCTILDVNPQAITYHSDVLDLNRQTIGDNQTVDKINTDQFVDWWLEKRNLFGLDPLPKAKFYVKSILPPDEDEFWTVKCIHRIWGNGKEGGPLEVNVHMTLKTYEIEKSRLDLGSWLYHCEITQVDVFRSKKPLFTQTEPKATNIFPDTFYDNWQAPLKEINTGGVYATDYNRDGYTDMFITDKREDAGKMFTGKKDGKFVDETFFLGLNYGRNGRIAAFIDFDNDGWEDLFFPQQPWIFRSIKGEKFINITGRSNLPLLIDLAAGERKRISGIIPADFDLDGDIDFYITRSVEPVGSWLEPMQPKLAHNQLIRNDGNWKFTDVTSRTGTAGGGRSAFSAVWTDVNNDRYPDLYVINEFGNGTLLVNKEGVRFEEHKLTEYQNDFGSMGLTCGDFNNDGLIDLYIANMYSKAGSRIMGNMKDGTYPEEVQSRLRSMVAGGELYQNDGDLKFKPVGKDFQVHAAGWAWGTSMADLNNDGWLDLYVTAGFISRDRAKPDG